MTYHLAIMIEETSSLIHHILQKIQIILENKNVQQKIKNLIMIQKFKDAKIYQSKFRPRRKINHN